MKPYAIGVDVGGTTVKIGIFLTEGRLVEKWEIPTDTSDGGSHILPDIAEAVKMRLRTRQIPDTFIEGLGIGVPGPVTGDGVIHKCVNLGWDVFNIEETMSELTGWRVKAGNDANVAALGEMWQGGGQGHEDVVMVTLGTGVGAGVVCGGRILAGVHGAGGEIGHFCVNEHETESCGCGKKGCLEQYASANGIARLAAKKLSETDAPSVLRGLNEVTSKDVFDAAREGDALAAELVEDFGKTLGIALSWISSVVDPAVYVIGGGVSKAGEMVTDVIKKYFVPNAFHACRETEFALAELGNDAGIYGGVRMIVGE